MIKTAGVAMLGLAMAMACTVKQDLDARGLPQEGASGPGGSSSSWVVSGVGEQAVGLGGGASMGSRVTNPFSPFFQVCAQLEAVEGEAEGQLEKRRRAFLQSYCTDAPMETTWTRCVGFSSMGGVPVTQCSSSVIPYVECLLASETTSPAQCTQELGLGCDPQKAAATGAAADTSACHAGVEGVNYLAGVAYTASREDCDDGHHYGVSCQAPSADACVVHCHCFRDDVETENISFAGIEDLSFMPKVWNECGYPVGSSGAGGAADQ